MVAVQDGGGQAKELHLLPAGLVVIEGVELHGRLHQQLSLLVALHLTQRQQAVHQQLPPVLFGQNAGFTCTALHQINSSHCYFALYLLYFYTI